MGLYLVPRFSEGRKNRPKEEPLQNLPQFKTELRSFTNDMLRKALSLFLLLAFLLPQFSSVWTFIGFKLNQDYIARVLCINKDEPVSLCNGKCYLSSQLKKAEEKEKKSSPVSKREKAESTLFHFKAEIWRLPSTAKKESEAKFPEESFLFSSSYLNEIFRPPRLLFV